MKLRLTISTNAMRHSTVACLSCSDPQEMKSLPAGERHGGHAVSRFGRAPSGRALHYKSGARKCLRSGLSIAIPHAEDILG